MRIEHCFFFPLVFSVSGSVGKECSMFHKRMAQKIANKTGERYEEVMPIVRCTLSFLFLQSCSMCMEVSKSLQKYQLVDDCNCLLSCQIGLN